MMKKEPDKLAQDVHSAIAAGMSYGMWKAMQQSAEPAEPQLYRTAGVCEYCGKTMLFVNGKHRKYCDDRCKYQAAYERRKKQMLESMDTRKECKNDCQCNTFPRRNHASAGA